MFLKGFSFLSYKCENPSGSGNNSIDRVVKKSFPNATGVIDRFHIQKLALDALQEITIKHR
jgi:transposase